MEIAAAVVEESLLGNPADDVLRRMLRAEHGVAQDVAAAAARLVFGYFRWCGWLDNSRPVRQQLEETLDLATRFARDPGSFGDEELACAVPSWVGESVPVAAAWLRSLQVEPRLWLRARPGIGPVLAIELGGCEAPYPAVSPDALWYRGTRDLFRCPAFHEGRFEVQDLASQLVGLVCAPRSGENWWDACAGEGGKALHLADLMENRGVVWATDRAAWRLQRLRIRASRAGLFNLRWGAWDGEAAPPARQKFDGVLLDAPCTGLGTWQRNPHARWTVRATDVTELASVQLKLLVKAAASVKPGGKLVYAACTVTREETQGVVRAFADSVPGFEPVPVGLPWRKASGPGTGDSNTVQIWPEELGSNGMFMAVWRKV